MASLFRAVAVAVFGAMIAASQDLPKPPDLPAAAPPKPQTEMSQKDEPALFKARVNLVQVPVVVRDRQGKAIPNLKKEDFQLLDKGKPQYIARFSMETATGRVRGVEAKPPDTSPQTTPPTDVPERFIAYLFDDIHSKFTELAQARDAVKRQIANGLRTTDRAAIYSTSGQVTQDFTDDRDAL